LTLFRRFLYYFGGFAIGLLLLFFFLGGKRASCDYGPNARTLKNIRQKPRVYAPGVLQSLEMLNLDTLAVNKVLIDGSVLFSESDTKLDSCKIYIIEESTSIFLKIKVENCRDTVRVLETAAKNRSY
jgi:hypothetical protein